MVKDRDLSTVRLTVADRDEAADLLTDAFFDNPGHTFIYPNVTTRRAQLRWLMYANLGAQLAVGQGFARRNANRELVAMAFWHAPGAPRATAEQLARFGFLEMASLHGADTFERMRTSVEEIERRRLEGLRGRPSWYLNNMVIRGDYRGQGLGTWILQRELREVVDPSGFPASLTTQKAENAEFYRRLGFEVADDRPIVLDGHGFQNWIMVYR